MVNIFQTSLSYSYNHCQQFELLFVLFGEVGTATLSCTKFADLETAVVVKVAQVDGSPWIRTQHG